jgi:beta-galactosidase
MPKNSHLQWSVKYTPGTLSARGYKGVRQVAEDKVETTGATAAIKLTPDRPAIAADGEDLSIITVDVRDAQGRVVPGTTNHLHFEISGPGAILGVGNGDPASHEPDLYFATVPTHSLPVNDWLLNPLDNLTNRDEIRPDFDDTPWQKTAGAIALKANDCIVLRTHLDTPADTLASTNILITFPKLTADAWIFLNGAPIGEAHDPDNPASFEIRPAMRQGTNLLAVILQAGNSPGVLEKGVTLTVASLPEPTPWQRSVFNGLAQIIVQSAKDPGKIQLTATSPGLSPTTLEITAQPAAPRPAVP